MKLTETRDMLFNPWPTPGNWFKTTET